MKNKNQNLVIEYKGILSYLQFKNRGMPDSQRYPWNLFKNLRSTSCSWVELIGWVQFLRHPHTQTYTQFHTQIYTQFYTQTYTHLNIFSNFENGQFLQVLRPDNFCKSSPCGLTLQPFNTLFAWFETALNKWIKYYNIFSTFKIGRNELRYILSFRG